MSRSRGALPNTLVDRYFPYQVMLKNDARFRKQLWEISHLASKLGAHNLGHHFYFPEEEAHYSVYCFPTRDSAQTFLEAQSGEWLTPVDRKKGNWRPRTVLPETDSGILQIYRLGQQCRRSEP